MYVNFRRIRSPFNSNSVLPIQSNSVFFFFFFFFFSAWDCSGWVRTYALFLEERLECFRVIKYDIEAERLPRPSQGQEKVFDQINEYFLC
jgi:hypothetical protein